MVTYLQTCQPLIQENLETNENIYIYIIYVENTLVQFEFDFLLLDSLEQLQQKKKIQN